MEKDAPHTLIFFESPFRIAVLLRDALEVLGDREAAVCFELTKHHERVLRGPLSELYARFDGAPHPKGEITVVIAGNNPKFLHKDEPSEND